MDDTTEAWRAFLNPEIVRSTLAAAGLFLIGYEMLVDTIKRHPLDFFASKWTVDGPELSDSYRETVLALDPKGKSDALRGSIAWLRRMEIITEDDELSFRKFHDVRNEVAHEMQAMVGGSKPPQFAEHFAAMTALTDKIEKWWLINVEFDTDPDIEPGSVNEVDIVPGPIWLMQLLAQVALGNEDEAWFYHRRFEQELKASKNRST